MGIHRLEGNSMTDTATARSALAAISLGFGVAGVFAPRTLAKLYDAPEPTPEHVYTLRIWAAATTALGALGLMEDAIDDERYLQLGIGVNLIDAVAGATTAASPRFRVMTALTSAGLAGLAASALAGD